MPLWLRKYFICVPRKKDKSQKKNPSQLFSRVNYLFVILIIFCIIFRSSPFCDGFKVESTSTICHCRVVWARWNQRKGGWAGHAACTQSRAIAEQTIFHASTTASIANSSSHKFATSECPNYRVIVLLFRKFSLLTSPIDYRMRISRLNFNNKRESMSGSLVAMVPVDELFMLFP